MNWSLVFGIGIGIFGTLGFSVLVSIYRDVAFGIEWDKIQDRKQAES